MPGGFWAVLSGSKKAGKSAWLGESRSRPHQPSKGLGSSCPCRGKSWQSLNKAPAIKVPCACLSDDLHASVSSYGTLQSLPACKLFLGVPFAPALCLRFTYADQAGASKPKPTGKCGNQAGVAVSPAGLHEPGMEADEAGPGPSTSQ